MNPAGTGLTSEHVLVLWLKRRGYHKRFGVCAVPRGMSERRALGGPMVDGPWAHTFGLCIPTDRGPAATTARDGSPWPEHDIADGDLLEIDGVVYRVQALLNEHIELHGQEG
ncbi:MAG: hypothetical protein ACYS8K_11320 [Planctomycetota bacterium]|jgi:hypothetical protein